MQAGKFYDFTQTEFHFIHQVAISCNDDVCKSDQRALQVKQFYTVTAIQCLLSIHLETSYNQLMMCDQLS